MMMLSMISVVPAVSFVFIVVGSLCRITLRVHNNLSILQGYSGQALQKLASLLAVIIKRITIVQVCQEIVLL